MRRIAFLFAALVTTGCIAVVGNTTRATVPDNTLQPVLDGRITAHAEAIEWRTGPASLPAGAQMSVLEGDPTNAGPFTMRLRLPRNFSIQPHYHTAIEHLTVLSGRMHMGMGERVDMGSATLLTPGSFSAMPPGMRHYVHTLEETVVQVHGIGPWRIIYVNANDDPRSK